MKTKLLGSAASKERLACMIGSYFFYDVPFDLREKEDGTFSVHYPASSKCAGKLLEHYIVKNKKGRYRFELILQGDD
jgi:hypothetical protein